MFDNILIDGKNVLYRSLFASESKTGNGDHPLVILLRQMNRWRKKFDIKNWRIFWDVRKEDLWRKKVIKHYKDGRNFKKRIADVEQIVPNLQSMCALIFHNMKITQYIKDANEADDLIYSYVVAYPEEKNLIISSDKDITQIIYKFDNASIHNPDPRKNSDFIEKPEFDPVLIKALSGDPSDNIRGYRLVGEKTAQKILLEDRLDDFLSKKGRQIFDVNMAVIDLGRNPYLQKNIDYIKNVKKNTNYDFTKITKIMKEHGVTGYKELVMSFKHIGG